ncbi:unannotated protein [freshwater metagenome]|uniref:Unannotated protein n=1 Tax=freshwater metagenome TaxID=449393 RepID=A0A6J6KBR6_9ZZZZ|nr:hypothetical protein [Actinomycetota bacterium]MSZ28873.1 hypothetical protein [Actinomycetota bacterium]
MNRTILERRLVDVSERLKRLRAEYSVTAEQLVFMEDDAEDKRLRSLVAETPIAEFEAREATRHSSALAEYQIGLASTIKDLELEQDSLLDRMAGELLPPENTPSQNAPSENTPSENAGVKSE